MKKILLLLSVLLTCWQINAQYCTPTILTNGCTDGDNIDDFIIPAAGFSHLGSGCSIDNYGDFSADATLQIDLQQSVVYNFQATHGYNLQFVKIWIDYNVNDVFEASEVAFASTVGSGGTFNAPLPTDGSFTMPLTSTQGLTRMRVITSYNSEPIDSCNPSNNTFGETHDYTVNILPPPTCIAPTNVSSVAVTTTTADFTWDDVPGAINGYIWEVYNQGDDPSVDPVAFSGTFPANSTSGQATGLNPTSDYDFYLTADCGATDGTSTQVGPVSFSTLATCLPPANVNLANTQNQSADFTWDDEPGAINGYLWEVFNAGDDPDADPAVSSGTFPAGSTSGQATGLLASSDYDFYLTSDCGATNGQSFTVGPISFSTLCDVIVAPFTQDFNLAASIPNCWEQGATNSESWLFGTGQTYTNIPVGTESPSGGNNAHIDDSTPDNLGTTLLSPLVDVSGLTTPALFFYWTSGDLGIYLPVDFRVDVWDGAAWNNVFERTSASGTLTNGFEEVIADLSTLTITGPVQVRFVVDEVEAGDFQDDIAIDDVMIDEAPTCLKPLNFTSLDVFFDSIEVSWNGVGNATSGYVWEVYAAGDDPAVDTPVSTGTFPAGTTQGIADGLMPEMDYDIYLASDCGAADGISEFTNPISFTTTPLCNVPSTFEVINIQPDSAELSWSGIPNAAGYNWAVFNSGDDPTTATPVASGSATDTDTSVVVTGLTDNASYDAYITTDCNPDGLSAQSAAVSFTTPCLPFVAPFLEDFTSASGTTPPACWFQGDANNEPWEFGAGETYTNIPAGTESPSGGNNAHIDDSTPDNLGTTLLTPLVDVSGLTTPALSFYWTSGDLGIYLPVDFRVDVWDGAAWNNVFERTSASGTITNGFEEVIADLSTLTITGPVQARFIVDEVEAGDFQDDLGIDDVRFDEAPTCLKPLGLVATNETVDGVDISWNGVGNATSGYIWSVFNAGDDPLVDTPILTGTVGSGVTSTTITGLSAATDYQVYIQSDCGATDGLSDFSSSASFTTLCDIFIPNYLESFDNYLPNCWEEAGSGDPTTGPSDFGNSLWLHDQFLNGTGADNSVNINLFTTNREDWLISPTFDLTGGPFILVYIAAITDFANGNPPELNGMGSDDEVQVLITEDDGLTWTALKTYNQSSFPSATGDLEIIDLSAYTGNVRFAFWATDGTVNDTEDYDFFVDEFEVKLTPECFEPLNLTATNETLDGVDISWDAEANATSGYIWSVFNAGDDPLIDTPVLSGTVGAGVTTATITGLGSSSTYQVYVQSDCGASDGVSDFSSGVTFGTLCGVVVAPFFEDFNLAASIPNCWEQGATNNEDWEFGPGETYTNIPVGTESPSGGNNAHIDDSTPDGLGTTLLTPLIDVSPLTTPALFFYWTSGDLGIYLPVDFRVDVWDGAAWNNVFTRTSASGTLTNGFEEVIVDLSTLTITGPVQVRFVVDEVEAGDFQDDLGIDDIKIDEAPTCLKPINLTSVDVFFDSIEVSWSPVSNATSGYIWEVYAAGDDPAVDTPVSTGTFPAGSNQGIADGLMPEIDYDIYLASDCGATDGISEFTNPVSFTTSELCSLPSSFSVSNVLPDTVQLNWTSVPNAANGYNWAVFNAGDDPLTATPVASGNAPSTDNSVVVTGLTDNSSYDAYITTDCDTDGLSDQSPATSFTTPCLPFVAPYFEDFNAAASIPACWNQGDNNAEDWEFGPGETYTNIPAGTESPSGGNNAHIDDSTPDNIGTTLLTPLVDVSGLTTPALSFYWTSGDLGIYLPVDFRVDVWDGAAWNNVFTRTSASGTLTNGFEEVIADLSTLTITGPVQARFVVDEVEAGDFQDDLGIDDVRFDEAPSCLKPLGLSVTNITNDSVDISWNGVGNATSGYIWSVFNAGDDPLVDTPVLTGSVGAGVTSTTITGLNSSTSFDVYIQSDCGATDGLSELSTPAGFQTLCDIFVAPFFENFNASPTTIPNCWDQGAGNAEDWLFTDTPTGHIGFEGSFSNSTFSGGGFAWVDDSAAHSQDTRLLSPLIDISGIAIPALSFYFVSNNEGETNVDFSVEVWDGAAWNQVFFSNQNSANGEWQQVFVDLSTLTITGNIQLAFVVDENNGNDFDDDLAIDDVRVDEAPTCFDPNGLEVLSVTDTSAELNWLAGSSETVFDVEVVLAGATPTGVPTFEDVTLPFTATGLMAETEYDFYVRADCGAGDVSNWAGPVSFTTVFTPTTVVVNAPATNNTYCYGNDEVKEWLFVSSDGVTPVELQFTAGEIENDPDSSDRCRIFDGFDINAPVLYDTDIDGTDMTGVQLVANSGAAYIYLESDNFESCQGGLANLVPLDFDVFAGTVSTEAFSNTNFNFYPNPVRSILNIESANPISSIQVYDMLGKVVYDKNFDASNLDVNLQELSSGTYLMKVSIGDFYETFRIIKE